MSTSHNAPRDTVWKHSREHKFNPNEKNTKKKPVRKAKKKTGGAGEGNPPRETRPQPKQREPQKTKKSRGPGPSKRDATLETLSKAERPRKKKAERVDAKKIKKKK